MISDKQRKILAFPYSGFDAIICDGAVRSGKTSIMMWAFVHWAMENFDGQRFGICGKTVDSATKNIVIPFISMGLAKERYVLRWRRSDKLLEVKNGSSTNWFEVFGGKDESSFALIQGRTLAGVLLDEVVLMPESFVNQALARCSVKGNKKWFSCNPGSPQHWFYQEWIKKHREKNTLYLHFEMTDNPALSQEVLEQYETMYSGVFYDRYVRGKWVLAEGRVYPMFSEEQHVTEEYGSGNQYYVSCDYGTVNPTVFLLWKFDLMTCKATCIKEYYQDSRKSGQQKTPEEHYADLVNFIGGKHVQYIIVDPSAAAFKETIRRHGRYIVKNADNDVIPGIQFVSSLLKAGMLQFNKDCENLISEFEEYMWDDKLSEDAVIKENDHAMDAMRYFARTVMWREIRSRGLINV